MGMIEIFVCLLATLIGLLQLMYQGKDVTPFDTHYTTMVIFLLALFIFAIASISASVTDQRHDHPQNPNQATSFMTKIKLFSGGLSLNMLLLILVPALGWFLLAVGFFYFVKVVFEWSYLTFQCQFLILLYKVFPICRFLSKDLHHHNHRHRHHRSNGEHNNRPPV